MGINHLWKVSTLCVWRKFLIFIFFIKSRSLHPLPEEIISEIAVREGFESNRHGTGVVVVGIDARCVIQLLRLKLTHFSTSTWFYESQVSAVRDVSIYTQAKIQNFGSFLSTCCLVTASYQCRICIWWSSSPKTKREKPSAHFHIGCQHHSEN